MENSFFSKTLLEFLQKEAVTDDKLGMEAYMKHRFNFIGTKSEKRKAALRATIQACGIPEDEHFEEIIKQFWKAPYRELHYCAQELVHRKKWWRRSNALNLIEHMMRSQQWWDTIDYIASTIVGSYFEEHGTDRNIIKKWNEDKNFWVIRTSILFQLKYKDEVDLELLDHCITPHLSSNEFFLQKAIGWSLRQVSKSNPDWVKAYVTNHQLKPVSLREAKKYI